MALRRPVYLDIETLMALGDYHGMDMPRLTFYISVGSDNPQ